MCHSSDVGRWRIAEQLGRGLLFSATLPSVILLKLAGGEDLAFAAAALV